MSDFNPSDYEFLPVEIKGGMCVVRKIRDKRLNRYLALKAPQFWLMDNEALVARFLEEAKHIAGIEHANVVSVIHVGKFDPPDGRPFYTMKWLDGETLDARCRRDPSLGPKGGELLGQLADALEAVHSKNLVHRDVKPNNIMIVKESGGSERLKLFDFGIVKDSESHGQTDGPVGTRGYMAPEQLDGGPINSKADIYAFGVLLYELFTHTRLPRSPSRRTDRAVVEVTALPRIDGLNPEVSPDLANMVLTMLSSDPAQRPSIAEVIERLKPLRGAPLPQPSPTSAKRVVAAAGSHLANEWSTIPPSQDASSAALSGWDEPVPPTLHRVTAKPPTAAPRPLRAILVGVCMFILAVAGWTLWMSTHMHPGSKPSPPNQPDMGKVTSVPLGMVAIHPKQGPPFFIDETEVSIGSYKDCVRDNKCRPTSCTCDDSAKGTIATCNTDGREEYPITCVTWEQADTYCRAQGKRLPTSAEWVCAAYGEGRKYPWGSEDDWQKRVCLDPKTCPVTSMPQGRSPEGVYHFAGNVSEWTQEPCGSPRHLSRGGSVNTLNLPKSLSRDGKNCPYGQRGYHDIGFRCVMSMPQIKVQLGNVGR